jgi:hypothetical protein
MPAMLSWVNLADAAQEITATREASGLGVRNLLTEPIAEVWRVPEVAAATVTDLDITLPAAAEIGVVALFAPRDGYLPPGYTVELLASTVSIGAGDVLSIAAAPLALSTGRGAWWHWPAAAVTARFLRLRFTAVSGDSYLQFGRLWIGPDFRPAKTADWNGYQRGWQDAGIAERSAISGFGSFARGATMRAPRFVLPMLTDAEADSLEAAAAAVGTTGQLIANARTQRGATDLVIGRLAAPLAPEAWTPVHYRCAVAMMEDL